MTYRAVASWLRALACAALLAPALATAHDVQAELSPGPPLTVRLVYGDGEPFAYERYEVIAADAAAPLQAGRTDADGRVTVMADGTRALRLRAFAENGHGINLAMPAATAGTNAQPAPLVPRADTVAGRIGRGAAGVLLIAGAGFAAWAWQRRQCRTPA